MLFYQDDVRIKCKRRIPLGVLTFTTRTCISAISAMTKFWYSTGILNVSCAGLIARSQLGGVKNTLSTTTHLCVWSAVSKFMYHISLGYVAGWDPAAWCNECGRKFRRSWMMVCALDCMSIRSKPMHGWYVCSRECADIHESRIFAQIISPWNTTQERSTPQGPWADNVFVACAIEMFTI